MYNKQKELIAETRQRLIDFYKEYHKHVSVEYVLNIFIRFKEVNNIILLKNDFEEIYEDLKLELLKIYCRNYGELSLTR